VKLGISSYTFGWAVGVPGYPPAHSLDEHGLLDKCHELGVNLLQIGDNLPLHTFSPARLNDLAARAERESIQIEVGARRLSLKNVTEYITIALRLNAKLLRFVIDDADFRPSPGQVADTLSNVDSALEGLILGIENHDRFPAEALRQIMEDVGSDKIGICLDTPNSLGAGEGLQTVLGELARFTVNLHIKDFHIERLPHLMGFSVTGRPAGAGSLEVPRLLEQLAPFKRCRTAILELWTPPETHIEQTVAKESAWAVQSLEYLKPFFSSP